MFFFSVSHTNQQYRALIDSFRMAWKIVRSSLIADGEYFFLDKQCLLIIHNLHPSIQHYHWSFCIVIGPFSISQEMSCTEVKNSTSISMFLPTKSGLGKCALALNNFLINLHNDFIGRCRSLLNDETR